MFTRLKLNQCPALGAPRRTLSEATDEQKKLAMAVALATAAAAEAAVAAAHAAAAVVRLTGTPYHTHTFDKDKQNLAAIKIQTAFRGLLVRFFFNFTFFYNHIDGTVCSLKYMLCYQKCRMKCA